MEIITGKACKVEKHELKSYMGGKSYYCSFELKGKKIKIKSNKPVSISENDNLVVAGNRGRNFKVLAYRNNTANVSESEPFALLQVLTGPICIICGLFEIAVSPYDSPYKIILILAAGMAVVLGISLLYNGIIILKAVNSIKTFTLRRTALSSMKKWYIGVGVLFIILVTILSAVFINLNHGGTALMWSSEMGIGGLVKALIASGVDINIRDINGKTSLMKAADGGHTDIVIALINAKADVNYVTKAGDTALMFASYNGNTDTINELIKAKADVNYIDKEGNTALIFAALKGQTEAVKALIKAGADVNIDKGNWTALKYATQKGYSEIIDLLRKAGAR